MQSRCHIFCHTLTSGWVGVAERVIRFQLESASRQILPRLYRRPACRFRPARTMKLHETERVLSTLTRYWPTCVTTIMYKCKFGNGGTANGVSNRVSQFRDALLSDDLVLLTRNIRNASHSQHFVRIRALRLRYS